MRVAFGAQLGVVFPAALIALDADASPMIERVAQSRIAALPHHHHSPLPTLPRDGSRPCVTAQSVIISFSKRLRSFREHRGGDDSTHSRQGKKDGHVAMLP